MRAFHVKDVMTRDVVAVKPETPLKEVAEILAERGISGLPVVDDKRRVLGVVSEGDIVLKQRGEAPRKGGVLASLLHREHDDISAKLEARTAGEVMTSPAIIIDPDHLVSEAATLMVERRVNRLPVAHEDGTLVGIVTRADLVKSFARSDREIEDEIREDVVYRSFWLAPETITVKVNRGEVTLGGQVDTRSVAELLASFVQRVPGVVTVKSSVTWREDDRKRG